MAQSFQSLRDPLERRHFLRLAGGMALLGFAAGCGRSRNLADATLAVPEPRARRNAFRLAAPHSTPNPTAHAAHPVTGYPGPCADSVIAEPRQLWRATPPIVTLLRPLGGVQRVTIHHEGGPRANWDTDARDVATTLRRIQIEHERRMRAGDIGYHYIVDRAGRVWQGRSHQYQGAHVAGNNEMNLGVMVLGNFELQQPTARQLDTLQTLCHTLLHGYQVPASELLMHRELAATRCPGKHLAPRVAAIRSRLLQA